LSKGDAMLPCRAATGCAIAGATRAFAGRMTPLAWNSIGVICRPVHMERAGGHSRDSVFGRLIRFLNRLDKASIYYRLSDTRPESAMVQRCAGVAAYCAVCR
jgi:hypothetical protein